MTLGKVCQQYTVLASPLEGKQYLPLTGHGLKDAVTRNPTRQHSDQ
ncbi:hypothetical protein ACFV16_01875 [Streptomyces massasporeus]